jgi:segregation and condensation protein A
MSDPSIAPASDGDDWDKITERRMAEALILDIDGFEGPLDVLLTLGRTQKVDLRKISILQLTEQYIAFIQQARALRIELAADYLVMAAWLAYLKSRLLLPPDPTEEGPSGEDLAAHLAFQLERLAAMRDCAAQLMARDRLYQDRFPRGQGEDIDTPKTVTYSARLMDLMQAYARLRTKEDFRPYVLDRQAILTMEQALDRMRALVGDAFDWTDLTAYLPDDWRGDPKRLRSATAAHFAAVLELTKSGQISLRQSDIFAPIELRKRPDA